MTVFHRFGPTKLPLSWSGWLSGRSATSPKVARPSSPTGKSTGVALPYQRNTNA